MAKKGARSIAQFLNEVVAPKAGMYTKQQFLAAEQYRAQRDMLQVLLVEGSTYTKAQVQQLIEGFLKKEAN